MKAAFFTLFFLTSLTAFAQKRGTVEEFKDPQIDSLIAWRKASAAEGGFGSISGYRVQFFSGSDRREAYEQQNRFQELFPEMRTYISYVEPNYKIRGGDFRTRLEAQRFMQEIRPQFPALFLIREKINPPKLDTADAQ